MECITPKAEITSTFSNVRNFSFEEKRSPLLGEDKINLLLDSILDFKASLNNKSEKIYRLNEEIEKITWLNDLDEECLQLLNDIISSAKDLRSSLVRSYLSMNSIKKRGIAKEEIKDFKNSIDELKEAYEDLESVFFILPKMRDFEETTKKLSLV